ncbi:MAG: homocysteine S-methyltransferase family protein [Acutalibacteraceae bacterium]|jgi:5-methyltetrahydrofolate--homocysteine methyltransferase
MNVLDFLQEHILVLDGGMGTLLQQRGLQPGELPERWNLSRPDDVTAIHRAYFDAGSHVVMTNTFGANRLKFSAGELDQIVAAAVENARRAARESTARQPKWVALDVGPTGRMLAPYGDLGFEEAVAIFADTVRAGVRHGADLIVIETMNDSYETKAALLAAKENSDLPVFVSNAYGEDGKLMTGASPEAMTAMLEGLGADAIGLNCSLGPAALAPAAGRYLQAASVPVLLKPNAGLPRMENGQTVYDVDPSAFCAEVAALVKQGVRIVGGCCGTTPEYIAALAGAVAGIPPAPVQPRTDTVVSSYTHAVTFEQGPVLIGERINPTGKKRLKAALVDRDMDYLLGEGIRQQEKGAHILDVNVGLPEIDEAARLPEAVAALQAVVDLPLQIDTADPAAMAAALRVYNGKPLINSVNGKAESMDAIFPLAKKYGGVTVALTLDEQGIPATAEGRLAIARRIVERAAQYGIGKRDLIFDPLAMAVSADQNAARETLRAVKLIRQTLGCHVSLGVSNVSFGLPRREAINSAFFAMALQNGLSAAIMNPDSDEMRKVYFAYRTLQGLDDNCADYIAFAASLPQTVTAAPAAATADPVAQKSALQDAIVKGLRDAAAALTGELLATTPPLEIVTGEIIPALDVVGVGFEKKTVYLPQLLMSAEAAKAAFERIKTAAATGASGKCAFVLATVKGDIHDIGKNIVKLLLENYGFEVHDMGRDVPPQVIADEVVRIHAPLAGLSALMTTTVPAMEETIKLLRQVAPWCRIVVGGAVLTQEYADAIGADHYAHDAMETVRYAEKINDTLS